MIRLKVKTNTIPGRMVSVDVTDTPASVFDEIGIDVSTSMVTLDGMNIRPSRLGETFAALGIEDGSEVPLSAIVKMDGAKRI